MIKAKEDRGLMGTVGDTLEKKEYHHVNITLSYIQNLPEGSTTILNRVRWRKIVLGAPKCKEIVQLIYLFLYFKNIFLKN